MSYRTEDKLLTQAAALPNGAASTQIAGFDLGHDPTKLGRFLADMEFELSVPALTTTELGDTQTISFDVEMDDNAAFSSATVLYDNLIVVTGAGGAGAVAAKKRFRLPSDVERFVRVKATKAGASNASTKSMTVKQLF